MLHSSFLLKLYDIHLPGAPEDEEFGSHSGVSAFNEIRTVNTHHLTRFSVRDIWIVGLVTVDDHLVYVCDGATGRHATYKSVRFFPILAQTYHTLLRIFVSIAIRPNTSSL